MSPSFYLNICFQEALKGIPYASPNPLVGAVLVKNGKIIGLGHHEKCGENHAEVNAIKNATEDVAGATLYCSLEPCCHTNKRTPPCTELIIKSRISTVIVSNLDPNPEVSGKGLKILEMSGIKVEFGEEREKGEDINEVFFKYIKNKIPFVHLKWAQSLDAKLCTDQYDSKWITNEESREYAHYLRYRYDAVLIGKNTFVQDAPNLSPRGKWAKEIKKIVVGNFSPDEIDAMSNKSFIAINTKGKKLSTSAILQQIGALGISSVLVEGGPATLNQFLNETTYDKVTTFIAPIFIGNGPSYFESHFSKIADAISLKNVTHKSFGNNLVIEGSK